MITEARRRQYLHEVVEAWDAEFDPEVGVLLRAGPGVRRARGQAAEESACAREESMHYAFALLELAERARQGRAEAIIRRVIDLPATDETKDVALALVLIWHRHRRRLPKIVVEEIAATIIDAAGRIGDADTTRASVGPGALINDLFILLSAAKITDSDDWMARALDRLDELRKVFGSAAPFPVKIDADDVAAGLAVLQAITSHISDERVSEAVALLSSRFWREVSFPLRGAGAATRIVRGDMPALLVEMASRGAARGRAGRGRAAYAALYACVMKAEPTEALRT